MKALRKPIGILTFLFIPIVSMVVTFFYFIPILSEHYSFWYDYWKSGKPWGVFDK